LRIEEQTFDRTLERGMARCAALFDKPEIRESKLVPGQAAFELHDTFGFPVELTREIAAERGYSVDMHGFEQAMNEQRERARRDAASKRPAVAVADLPALKSEFTGYEGLESEGTVA